MTLRNDRNVPCWTHIHCSRFKMVLCNFAKFWYAVVDAISEEFLIWRPLASHMRRLPYCLLMISTPISRYVSIGSSPEHESEELVSQSLCSTTSPATFVNAIPSISFRTITRKKLASSFVNEPTFDFTLVSILSLSRPSGILLKTEQVVAEARAGAWKVARFNCTRM